MAIPKEVYDKAKEFLERTEGGINNGDFVLESLGYDVGIVKESCAAVGLAALFHLETVDGLDEIVKDDEVFEYWCPYHEMIEGSVFHGASFMQSDAIEWIGKKFGNDAAIEFEAYSERLFNK